MVLDGWCWQWTGQVELLRGPCWAQTSPLHTVHGLHLAVYFRTDLHASIASPWLWQNMPLELRPRPVAGSHFARPGKSAAAAAVTLSTQRVNEHQIESLQQINYSWCILRCFMIYPWVNILSDSWCNGKSLNKSILWEKIYQYPRFKEFLGWSLYNFILIIQFGTHLPPVLTVWWQQQRQIFRA